MSKLVYTEPVCKIQLIQTEQTIAQSGAQTPKMTEEDDLIFPA